LEDSFRLEMGCSEEEARRLADAARQRVPEIARTSEDSDEDLLLRLRDPRIFGAYVDSLLADRSLPEALRISLAERVFDLLPLPRTEGEVILVEARAPQGLLALAAFLVRAEALTVLHALHLVYAVFLDRRLLMNVDRRTRSVVLWRILEGTEPGLGLRTLYACLHLATVPESEAHGELRRLLRSHDVPEEVKASLARIVASEDGGVAALTRLAVDEGLLPPDVEDVHSPEVVANIPRLPARLAALGRRWLARRDDR